MKVLGVMSDAAPPAPVLAATRAAAALFDATPVALHVRTADGDEAARGAAADAGLAFRSCDGPLLDAVTLAAHPPDVVAVVLGSADVPDLLTLQVVAGVDKPVVVAPPGGRQPAFRRILVPLEGTEEGRDAIADVLAAARGHGIEVVVVHVHRADALPAVEDQPGHEFTAWTREFMTRWAPAEITKHPLELRVGRPAPRLAEATREAGADLVVLSWSGRLEPGRAAVVRSALAGADVPVMLVRTSVESRRTSAQQSE